MKAPVLTGETVLLRPLQPGDRSARKSLGYHSDIEHGYGSVRGTGPMTDGEAEAWGTIAAKQSADPSRLLWMIEAGGELVGSTDLHAISDADSRARFAIGMFSPEHLGRGYGTDATRLVLGHAFVILGLHRVDLRVLDFNTRAIRLYRRCGFVVEGRERESCRINERWHDDIVMALLAHEHETTSRGNP